MPAQHAESQKETAVRLLGEQGIMRLSELKAAGVHYQTLARMTEDGSVLRVGRGLYQLPEADYSLTHSLATMLRQVAREPIARRGHGKKLGLD